jgi:uncharacterized membrane protein
MQNLRTLLNPSDESLVLEAIRQAESRTSGEIRVRIERKTGRNPMAAAWKAFEALGMRNTELRNGVLFFVTVKDRRFVIVGDDGIDRHVPSGFWDHIRDVVTDGFRKGAFGQGLTEGIRLAGEQLAIYFPSQPKDINELTNAISYSDDE